IPLRNGKPGRLRLPANATAVAGTNPLRDRDTFVLECLPRTTSCPTTTTTTTTTTSTTTTTTLMCGGFPPDTLPAGSYQASCVNCGVSGSVLSCRCANQSQDKTDCQNHPLSCASTSLDLANCLFGPDISNNNAVLTCAACTPGG